ncbi:MAG: helix-turn-helix domain-containing protein [Solirubrobacteraceae bacterium]
MTPSTLRNIAAAVRGRRQDLGLSQADVAARTGVSRQWLSAVEGGKSGVELGLVLRLLDVLDLRIELRPTDGGAASERPPAVDLDALLDEYGAASSISGTAESSASGAGRSDDGALHGPGSAAGAPAADVSATEVPAADALADHAPRARHAP